MKKKTVPYISKTGYPARELTEDTRWIVCLWDIKGDAPEETAMVLKRSLRQIREILDEAHADGLYDKVKRHVEQFDMRCPEGMRDSVPILNERGLLTEISKYDYKPEG